MAVCDFELKIVSMFVPGRSSGEDGKAERRSVGVVSVQLAEK